jgi:hypothetical protein
VDEIRATVRRISVADAAGAARALLSGESRDQQGELLGGRDGVVA